jgi:ketosteroid isomerase-like protein
MVLLSRIRLLPLGLLVLTASACGSTQDQPARDVAVQFYSAVADHDGRVACDLLAPDTVHELEQASQKPCVEGLFDENLPAVREPEEVRAYGTMAQVRYGGETVFLARFPDGWRVMAAGCTPAAAERYDCQVKGG